MSDEFLTRNTLLQRAQNPKDEQAWAEFVSYYETLIFILLRQMNIPYQDCDDLTQAVLAVWEENGPCATVGERLEKHHAKPGLKTDFIRAAQGKRGVMGLVLSAGEVRVGDTVLAYPPVK